MDSAFSRGVAALAKCGQSGGGDPSMCTIKVLEDGSIDVLIGSIDIGQGVRSIVRQIAAEELGVAIEKVNVSLVDTDTSPWDTGTFASRLTHHTGNATILAAREARQILFDVAAEMLDAPADKLVARDDMIMVEGDPKNDAELLQSLRKRTFKYCYERSSTNPRL